MDSDQIAKAVTVLDRGGLVAVPTETVYGLAADAANPEAVRRIFAAKGRPADHPLIVHVTGPADLARWAAPVSEVAAQLARALWPGPLTMILPKAPGVDAVVTGGKETIGLRAPAHPLTRALLLAFGGGLAAPSANRFGHVSPTTAQHVRDDLGDRVDLVLDGGACAVGIESTIVDLSVEVPTILRLGAIGRAALEAVVGGPVVVGLDGPVKAPGQLPSHYAPRAALEVWQAAAVAARVAALRRGGAKVAAVGAGPAADVALPRDGQGYARGLYAALRSADALGVDVIVVDSPPPGVLGDALRDRLTRAAAPRP